MNQVPIIQFINKENELYQLSERINWDEIEGDLTEYYCVDNGRPSIPIRRIVGVVLLKRMFNENDESVVDRWKENPYWQYFKARAGIEPVIGHIKHDHRMIRNYLSGNQGDAINTLLAATGFNMMKILRRIKAETIVLYRYLHGTLVHYPNIKIWSRENQWVFQT